MTVIAQDLSSETIYAFSKGADLSIFSRLKDQSKVNAHKATISEIAKKGYRTLCYSFKKLPKDFTDADVEIEQELLGITGVED